MENGTTKHRRNLFEVDNARNLSMKELVRTFIPTQSFWRLISAKHHVLLGTRGHGKTAIVKMLSHNHLSLWAKNGGEPRVESAINDQEFIGIYVPTRLEWVGGLKNKPWLNSREREELFQWRLNLACCIAFLPIAESCIKTYIKGKAQQAKIEKALANQLSEDWIVENPVIFNELSQLRQYIEDFDYKKQIQIIKERVIGSLEENEVPVGIAFGMDLFMPLRQGIKRISRLLSINPDCSWLLCLDEAEFLEEMDHRVINSHMRAYPDNLFFKVTTKPYCHHTLETNTRESLVHGHDFEYVNMGFDNVLTAIAMGENRSSVGTRFGRSLFRKVLEATMYPNKVSLRAIDILGESEILDSRKEEWDENSENMYLLRKYASKKTIERADLLINSGKIKSFRDQIGRKIQGTLLLRKAYDEWKGNKNYTVYSGARMAIRCSDSNPRRLLRIFNTLLMHRTSQQKSLHHDGVPSVIPPKKQSEALLTLSASTLNQIRSLPILGDRLHLFLSMIGEYMQSNIYDKPVSTDQITSIKIDQSISDDDWLLIQAGVSEGFLYPNVSSGNPDEMPWKEGVFHLAYILAPNFQLLPRRGKSTSINAIKKFHEKKKMEPKNNKQIQLSLFMNGEK